MIETMIGTPYSMDNSKGLNCWGVVAMYHAHIGRNLNNYTISRLSAQDVTAAFTAAFARNDHGFIQTDTPTTGDVVIFKNRAHIHCGLFVDGRVVHATPKSGVICQRLDDVYGFQTVEFWTYDNN